MSAGLLGPVALWAAIASAVVALVTGRRSALVTSAISGAVATTVLAIALLAGDFSLAYVAETTSLATPWSYRVAALWGGMDGSMLFYTSMLLGVGVLAVRSRAPVRAVGAVGLGLLLITVSLANPFTVMDIPAVDGQGLLAILQHPAMVYHPPILYLGLTALIVPFALTGGLVTGEIDRLDWLRRSRLWLYVSWTLLTIGMAAGANWAYIELGWGGYWAWDPVENTAFMPWLAATVFLHTSRLEEWTGRLRRWNVFFAGLPFALTVLGVYLTRSGATGSIHSFAEDPVVGRVLLVSAAVVAAVVSVVALRSPVGESWGPVRLDRNGWLAFNAALLTVTLVFVTAGSAYPAFMSVFMDTTVAVESRFFVLTVLPIAVLIAMSLYMAMEGHLVAFAVATVLAAGAGLAVAGPSVGVVLLAPAAASLLLLGVSLVKRRRTGRALVFRLAHLGMALFLVGVAGSSMGGDFNGSMRPGDQVEVAGHLVNLVAVDTGEADRYVFVRADFLLDPFGKVMLSPEIRAYEDQSLPVAEPVVRSSLVDDVIVAISLLYPDGETVEVSVFVRPLVTWVWVGAALMALAGLVALVWRDGAVAGRRRPATAGQQRGGTTSEGVAP